MKKILIVEDEQDLLRVLSQHLKNNNFQVAEAEA
jgi:DNA-binding response OmpR family regulator